MIEPDRRQHAHRRSHDIRGIKAPAHARFERDHLGALPLKPRQRQRGCDLKKSRRMIPAGDELANLRQPRGDLRFADHHTTDLQPFAERDEMRRGE